MERIKLVHQTTIAVQDRVAYINIKQSIKDISMLQFHLAESRNESNNPIKLVKYFLFPNTMHE
jgi:hypothetical protein